MSDGQKTGFGKPFKFTCPACGQHIQGDEEWSGRQVDCPSCGKPIIVPPPPKLPAGTPGATQTTPPAKQKPSVRASKPAVSPSVLQPPVEKIENKQPEAVTPKSERPEKPEPVAPSPNRVRIAVLTPAIKLEMIRSVRKRIANESSWLPGRINDLNAYAAKVVNEEPVLVDFKSPEATRFSLIGAFLLEFQLHRVIRTAAGRTEILDHEIPSAVRETLLNEMSDADRERTDENSVGNDPMAISHAQCLAALGVLEDHYSQRIERESIEKARRKLGNIRLPDLVKKLERKAVISTDDVATALYHEFLDVRRRLDRLERRIDEHH